MRGRAVYHAHRQGPQAHAPASMQTDCAETQAAMQVTVQHERAALAAARTAAVQAASMLAALTAVLLLLWRHEACMRAPAAHYDNGIGGSNGGGGVGRTLLLVSGWCLRAACAALTEMTYIGLIPSWTFHHIGPSFSDVGKIGVSVKQGILPSQSVGPSFAKHDACLLKGHSACTTFMLALSHLNVTRHSGGARLPA